MRVVTRHRHTPGELLFVTANANVFEAALQEGQDLVFATDGPDEKLVGGDDVFDLVRVGREFEKIVFFLNLLERLLVDRTDMVRYIGFGIKGLTADAVPAFIFGFIDVFGAGFPKRGGGFFCGPGQSCG